MKKNILDGLNEMQKQAVCTTDGPVLILAGAGSGKTKTLTHRIAYLICEKNVSLFNILAVTFTNKAAGEMKERIARLLENDNKLTYLPWMGTFHSICAKILRREIHQLGYRSSFSIYDDHDSLILVKRVMKDLGIDIKQYNPHAIKKFISGAKNELLDPTGYRKYSASFFQNIVCNVYEIYQKRLKESNALDFDDLIMITVNLFNLYPEVLEKYQNIFKYIMIDEYQDTNTSQYILVKTLSKKSRNICVVGDDWQAIYGFRGANFKNILNFEKDYSDAQVFKLEQNYRSTKNILDAANSVIKNNISRTDKTLWTKNSDGSQIVVFGSNDQNDEIEFIVSEISTLLRVGNNNINDFVILYRTNAQSRAVEEVLLQNSIPYRIIGGTKFYERKEIKDILAYLRLIFNPNDLVSLERIINVPSRGIGPKALSDFRNNNHNNLKIQGFLDLIDMLRTKSSTNAPSDVIDIVAEYSGYKKYILDGTEEGEIRWENINELKSVAQKYEKLSDFLEEVSLIADIDNLDNSGEAITLMTLHNAKGLEYSVVFIVGMEEGIFPHSRSILEPGELEEERRLFYVGITRAKDKLYLTHALNRLIYGQFQSNNISRFIEEIPEYLLDII